MAQPRLPKGMVQVYTGNGKGKTTAALGLAMRALGAGLRVAFLQLLKGSLPSSELAVAARLGPRLWIKQFQRQLTPFSMGRGQPTDEDRRAALQAWEIARKVMLSGGWDVVVLDEINNILAARLLCVEEVLAAVRQRPPYVEVICTGRGAPEELIAAADLVTVMECAKHPFDQGVAARAGIEF